MNIFTFWKQKKSKQAAISFLSECPFEKVPVELLKRRFAGHTSDQIIVQLEISTADKRAARQCALDIIALNGSAVYQKKGKKYVVTALKDGVAAFEEQLTHYLKKMQQLAGAHGGTLNDWKIVI